MTHLEVADQILQSGIASGIYSAAAFAVACGGKVVAKGAFGKLSFEPDAAAVTEDTVFDVASLTKQVATATSILQLAERGKLTLRQSVTRFFEPTFGELPNLAGIEVHHLLTHTSGLPAVPEMPLGIAATPDERSELVKTVLASKPLRPAGEGYTYSDTGYILLGEIVGLAGGMPLSEWVPQNICEPLGLKDTLFQPDDRRCIAATEPGTAPNTVHDPRARALGGVAGHAGLYSTVGDLIRYAEAIRVGGSPILSRASLARMAVSQIPSEVGGHSYGCFCAGNGYLPNGDLFSDRSYGHSGFTGCVLLIDPEFDVSVVLLTNRVLNTSEDGTQFLVLRRRWLNAVAGAVTRD